MRKREREMKEGGERGKEEEKDREKAGKEQKGWETSRCPGYPPTSPFLVAY